MMEMTDEVYIASLPGIDALPTDPPEAAELGVDPAAAVPVAACAAPEGREDTAAVPREVAVCLTVKSILSPSNAENAAREMPESLTAVEFANTVLLPVNAPAGIVTSMLLVSLFPERI